MEHSAVEVFARIWALVALGLGVYLIFFPVFMHRKISRILVLLERIAAALEEVGADTRRRRGE